MDDLARTEYPGMLVSIIQPCPTDGADLYQAHLQPGQATQTLNDRVKRINKINLEIADWLQVRGLAARRATHR